MGTRGCGGEGGGGTTVTSGYQGGGGENNKSYPASVVRVEDWEVGHTGL